MFKRLDTRLTSQTVCERAVDDLDLLDFCYYDKDGFELNLAEQKYYRAMEFPIDYPILNHTCWQEPWFVLEDDTNENLLLDHAMTLVRCSYGGAAREQIKTYTQKNPYALQLLNTRQKWGFDFALDALSYSGQIYEVVHIEYDHTDFDLFGLRLLHFEYVVRHTDWQDAANRIWALREQWQNLKGFEQNNWKAKYLLGWDRAEYIEKAV